jgi:toxin ParE1/3/4
MRLRWTSAAANDLENISDYLHHQNPQFAERTVRRLYAEIRELGHFPSRGRLGREPGTRELILSGLPYVIIFRALGSGGRDFADIPRITELEMSASGLAGDRRSTFYRSNEPPNKQ